MSQMIMPGLTKFCICVCSNGLEDVKLQEKTDLEVNRIDLLSIKF